MVVKYKIFNEWKRLTCPNWGRNLITVNFAGNVVTEEQYKCLLWMAPTFRLTSEQLCCPITGWRGRRAIWAISYRPHPNWPRLRQQLLRSLWRGYCHACYCTSSLSLIQTESPNRCSGTRNTEEGIIKAQWTFLIHEISISFSKCDYKSQSIFLLKIIILDIDYSFRPWKLDSKIANGTLKQKRYEKLSLPKSHLLLYWIQDIRSLNIPYTKTEEMLSTRPHQKRFFGFQGRSKFFYPNQLRFSELELEFLWILENNSLQIPYYFPYDLKWSVWS